MEDRRTNVAVTRARRHVTVVYDSDTVSHHPFLRGFVKYAKRHADYRYPIEVRDFFECNFFNIFFQEITRLVSFLTVVRPSSVVVLKIFSSLLPSQYPSALHPGRNSGPSALRCSRARPSASLRSETFKKKPNVLIP